MENSTEKAVDRRYGRKKSNFGKINKFGKHLLFILNTIKDLLKETMMATCIEKKFFFKKSCLNTGRYKKKNQQEMELL